MKKIIYFLIAVVIGFVIGYLARNVGATGAVNPSTIHSGNIFVQVWGKNSTGGNVWVGCIVKPDSTGKWSIVGGNHQNVGCTGVSQDSVSLKVSFTPVTKIVTSSIDADETMTVNGYRAGASVGLSNLTINIGN